MQSHALPPPMPTALPRAQAPARSRTQTIGDAITSGLRSLVLSCAGCCPGARPIAQRPVRIAPAAGGPAAAASAQAWNVAASISPAPADRAIPARRTRPLTLQEIWPDHWQASHRLQPVMLAIVAQRGNWRPQVIQGLCHRLDAADLAHLGEFAAHLENHPLAEGARALTHVLLELGSPAPAPLDAAQADDTKSGQNSRASEAFMAIAHGAMTGFIRLDQPDKALALFHRLHDQGLAPSMSSLADPLARLAFKIPTSDLVPFLSQISKHPRGAATLRESCLLMDLPAAQRHQFAQTVTATLLQPQAGRSGSAPPATAARTGRQTLFDTLGYHPTSRPLREWLGLLYHPLLAQADPDTQLVIGHAIGAATHDALGQRASLELLGRAAQWIDNPATAHSQRIPLAWTGVLLATDALQGLSILPAGPRLAHHLETWIALKPHVQGVPARQWFEQVERLAIPFELRQRLQRLVLQQDGAFAAVRDSLLADRQAPPAATLARLTDLYRYCGEREGLDFAFSPDPDLAAIRSKQHAIRGRMAAIEAAIEELRALAPLEHEDESDDDAFLREGIEQVAYVTLSQSLQRLQGNHALAWRAVGGERKAERDGKEG